MDYQMNELIPIVAMLADKYTSKESTSISYERANQLMEAAIYCMAQCNKPFQLTASHKLAALEVYKHGYQNLVKKVSDAQTQYNQMIADFYDYGNENYRDTVIKAIAGFFQYYDPVFAPQETIISMDYPTIYPIENLKGIDAIATYIEYIGFEQRFLNALPQGYIYGVLYNYQTNYRKQFYNICRIIFRHILGHMLIGKRLGESVSQEDYEILTSLILKNDKDCLETMLLKYLNILILGQYDNDDALKNYLQYDIKDFIVEAKNAASNNTLKRVIVL